MLTAPDSWVSSAVAVWCGPSAAETPAIGPRTGISRDSACGPTSQRPPYSCRHGEASYGVPRPSRAASPGPVPAAGRGRLAQEVHRRRVEPAGEEHHRADAGRVDRGHHLVGGLHGQRQRLVQEQVLAARPPGPRAAPAPAAGARLRPRPPRRTARRRPRTGECRSGWPRPRPWLGPGPRRRPVSCPAPRPAPPRASPRPSNPSPAARTSCAYPALLASAGNQVGQRSRRVTGPTRPPT